MMGFSCCSYFVGSTLDGSFRSTQLQFGYGTFVVSPAPGCSSVDPWNDPEPPHGATHENENLGFGASQTGKILTLEIKCSK